MTNLVAERAYKNKLPRTYEINNILVPGARDKIAELAETEEIKISRKECREFSESIYNGDILSFASALSFMCGKNIYVGQDVAVYFEILDMRDFLLNKYAELPADEAAAYKDEIESYVEEADEELAFLKSRIIKK